MKKRGVKNNVRIKRKRLDITQDELAQQVGVTRQTIIAIEKQRYEPTIGVALAIASALREQVENIFWVENN